MELPQKPPNHSGEHQGLVVLRTQVNNLVDAYLSQDPRPSLSDFAEVFGAQEYIETNKRKKAVIVRVAEFKESIVQRIWRNKKNKEDTSEGSLPQGLHMLDMTILPPDQQEIRVGNGNGLEEREYIPRTEYLRELLEEFGESYEIIGGKNAENMMRTRTYFIFFLERSKLAVFVNNEEGNATFVFHDVVTLENALYLAQLTKQELKEGKEHEFPMQQINWNGNKEAWQEEVLEGMTMLPKREVVKKQKERKKVEEEIEKAPADWWTLGKISKHLKKSYEWVGEKVKETLEKNPEMRGKDMLDSINKKATHYPPELVEIIKKKIEELPKKADEEWMNTQKIAKKINKSHRWVKSKTKEILKKRPELDGKILLDETNKQNIHYPKELVEIIKKEAEELPKKANEEWMNTKEIAEAINKSYVWTKRKIEKILKEKPELEGKEHLDTGNNTTKYYPPTLIELLKKEVEELPKKAEVGWLPTKVMASNLNKSDTWITNKIEKILKEKPELEGKELLDTGNRTGKYYPPTLIELLKKEVEELPKKAEVGWLTSGKIANTLKKSSSWVKRKIEKILKKRPELDGKILLDETNKQCKHYPPELVEILKQKARE